MATSKGYKALFIRADAREAVDRAKDMHHTVTGVDLNYSQFIGMICKDYVRELREEHPDKFMSDMKI